MKKSPFEEMGGTYRQEGDYLLPNLTAPQSVPVGIWGQRRRDYLRKHNETLKAANQMEWVRRMNNIRNRAEEIVLSEVVYV